MISFARYLYESKQKTERQENAFVDAVNHAVEVNMGRPITIITTEDSIQNVIKAEKFKGRQRSGSEPYTDVRLFTSKGIINLSMKGETAPSLAGGGLRGVEEIIPGIAARFFRAALNNHLKNNLKPESKVPDTYGKINDDDKMLLVIGNTAMGGPIDYMYIGPMDVISTMKDNKLTVNGKLIEAKKYANSKDLFFRLRARRNDQVFDPSASDFNGIPKIYSKSPSRGDSSGRLVITDKVPKVRDVIKF